MNESTDKKTFPTVYWIAAVLLFIGACTRIWGAWVYRNTADPDAGIVQLMAKHMAEGKEWPIFFYGQAYMGSLEPMVSALISYLFGTSGFTIALGSALLSIASLPVIFFWARGAAGNEAGLAALAFCMIGPFYYFFFQFAPRGGYPAALLIGSLVVVLTCRFLAEKAPDLPISGRRFFLLGLIAGLGWWSNQIVVYAMGTAGLLFVWNLKKDVFAKNLIPGAGGFFIGSLPFWIWNIRNHGESFGFLNSPGGGSLKVGFHLLIHQRIPRLLNLTEPTAEFLVLGLYALILLPALIFIIQACRQKEPSANRIYLISPILFLGIAVFIFCGSHFSRANTARYLIPMIPSVAVLIGVGTGWLCKRLPWKLGWLPLIALLGWQSTHLKKLAQKNTAYQLEKDGAEKLGAGLREKKVEELYTPFHFHWLNFMLDEEFVFCGIPQERYQPYAEATERSDRLGVLNNYGKLSEFVLSSGGLADRLNTGRHLFHFDFNPPSGGFAPIPLERWASAIDSRGQSVLQVLTDLNLDTDWQSIAGNDEPDHLEIAFDQPTEVAAVRMLGNREKGYPKTSIVKGLRQDGKWVEISYKTEASHYYWGGPRPYYKSEYFRLWVDCPPQKVSAIRIEHMERNARSIWHLTELQIFGPASAPQPETEALAQLETEIQARGLTALYADRWVANKISTSFEGRVRTTLDKRVFRHHPAYLSSDLDLQAKSGLLVRQKDAPFCRNSLAVRHISMRESEIGPWILFDFADGQWKMEYAGHQGLVWTGFTCLLGQHKKLAARILEQAIAQHKEKGFTPDVVERYGQGLEFHPAFVTAFPELPFDLGEAGFTNEAVKVKLQQLFWSETEISAPIRFSNGIELEGLSLDKKQVKPGGLLHFRYAWSCPPALETDEFEVFVHFVSGKNRFQDDHIFLLHNDQKNISFQPFKEFFIEERVLRIPGGTVPGSYRVQLGIIVRSTADRLKPRSKLEIDHRAVTIPLTIEVME